MDKVKCKCGVYGIPGSKCRACSSIVIVKGGVVDKDTIDAMIVDEYALPDIDDIKYEDTDE